MGPETVLKARRNFSGWAVTPSAFPHALSFTLNKGRSHFSICGNPDREPPPESSPGFPSHRLLLPLSSTLIRPMTKRTANAVTPGLRTGLLVSGVLWRMPKGAWAEGKCQFLSVPGFCMFSQAFPPDPPFPPQLAPPTPSPGQTPSRARGSQRTAAG